MTPTPSPTLSPSPSLLDPTALLKTLQAGLDIKITGELPGEGLMVALLTYMGTVRTTMDKGLRDRMDAVMVQQYEDLQKVWRGIWVAMGVIHQ